MDTVEFPLGLVGLVARETGIRVQWRVKSRPRAAAESPQVPAKAGQDPLLAKAYAQGQAHRAGLPKGAWTLRLEIACQAETVQHAAKLLEGTGESPFSLPIRMKDGKTCTQIFSGSFKTREEAQGHIKSLPAAFLSGGNKPSPFQVSEIPDKQ